MAMAEVRGSGGGGGDGGGGGGGGGGRVRVNVGGRRFVTSTSTIANAGRESMLTTLLLDENWQAVKTSEEAFIDRNPTYFEILLDLLRTGDLFIPPGISEHALVREALFYGLTPHVRSAKWKALDGNRIECSASIYGRAVGDAIAIRASSEGGCCVAHGCVVHVYDWMLEEQQPCTLDLVNVNDLGFLHNTSNRVIICTYERSDRTGGMGCFNTNTGELQHRFRLSDGTGTSSDYIGKNFTALAAASSEREVFASCRGRTANGIGIWDKMSGKNVSFFPSSFSSIASSATASFGSNNACKLQWIPSLNLLMAASLYPQGDHCFLSLFDLREKPQSAAVWEWTDADRHDDKVIMDSIAMDSSSSSSSICVVNQHDNLGFIDTRGAAQVKWIHRYSNLRLSESEEHSYSKLAINKRNGQIMSSRGDSVNVYCSCCCSNYLDVCECGRRSVVTAKLRSGGGGGGAISSMDVGGDRLFVLHGEDNVFDVWETP